MLLMGSALYQALGQLGVSAMDFLIMNSMSIIVVSNGRLHRHENEQLRSLSSDHILFLLYVALEGSVIESRKLRQCFKSQA
jgi:hypothetical protein